MGKVLVDLRSSSVQKKFLEGYTELDEVPHPDGHELVALKNDAGLFASFDDDGNPNVNVPVGCPVGWTTSPGANERFNVRGGAYIHDKSGAAIPRYAGTLAKLP